MDNKNVVINFKLKGYKKLKKQLKTIGRAFEKLKRLGLEVTIEKENPQ